MEDGTKIKNVLFHIFLDGTVEMDKSFFGATRECSKLRRGTEKTVVLVAASLTDDSKPKFVQMKAVESVDGKSVSSFAGKSIRKDTQIRTDGLNVYNALANEGYSLIKMPYDPKNKPEHLHWLHIIIANVKAFVLKRIMDWMMFIYRNIWTNFAITLIVDT